VQSVGTSKLEQNEALLFRRVTHVRLSVDGPKMSPVGTTELQTCPN
jgi:hypothetical protein